MGELGRNWPLFVAVPDYALRSFYAIRRAKHYAFCVSADSPTAYGMAPIGSIIRWMTDGWLTELTSKAAAKRSSNELSAVASPLNSVAEPILAVRLRKLHPSSFTSFAGASFAVAGGVSADGLLSTTGSIRRRSAVFLRGGVSIRRA